MAASVRIHGLVSFFKVRLTKDDRLASRFRGQVVDARASLIRGSVRDQVHAISGGLIVSTLRNLSVLGVFAVHALLQYIHRRDAENAKDAQSKKFKL